MQAEDRAADRPPYGEGRSGMTTIRVDAEHPEGEAIGRAAAVIRDGGLVAFPTETVYGLGANALDETAIARIYAAKGRPAHNPLIVHVADAAAARAVVTGWPDTAAALAAAFWPGPLTLVLPRHHRVPARVSAGLATVAVRVPAHPVALALLRAAEVPVVAPSANPSMGVSPTTAKHVARGLADRVDLILDAGRARVGIESTVVDLSEEMPTLLRPGAISTDDLRPFLGALDPGSRSPAAAGHRSPGMLDRHYAPRAVLRVFESGAEAAALDLARRAAKDGRAVGAILVDPERFAQRDSRADEVFRILVRMPPDPRAYARALYATLHRMDDAECDLVLVEEVPDTPAWAGVRDRLERAAS